ncbi:GNAT family N-acetyltransferase [Methylomonas methanica]|uniref:GCN5-related N-acetyltransferase n=1 Tax=Methylomonas methanica (strain DSM 25384 / MC09) TaxID=857087 RepID=F9ZWK5_METMM|nr:GNAT family N-acetyltransferase [Methylomonas methanica]AEG00852.1 GCN5-related N-acetyltransferase [Methylomonas methanica MC09]
MSTTIQRATEANAADIAVMVGELLTEIMQQIGEQTFNFDLQETADRLRDLLEKQVYVVFVAYDSLHNAVGFLSLSESHALYAEGAFGIVPELYVRPAFRSGQVGRKLVSQAKAYGAVKGWTRLEVTTPPLPQFDRTLGFYQREGFSISGGRKLKLLL